MCTIPVINAGGRVALDPAVFPDPSFPVPAKKNTVGTNWVMMVSPGISQVSVSSTYYLGLPISAETINPSPEPIVDFVMDGSNMLRSVNADGTLQNLLISCPSSSDINLWSDGIGYMSCTTANLHIVELWVGGDGCSGMGKVEFQEERWFGGICLNLW